MSGGYFDYAQYQVSERFGGAWRDAELNAMFDDLFGGKRDSIDLAHELDWWLSGDTSEKDYREAVERFKAKWMRRTPWQALDFYAAKLQERCDELKREMGAVPVGSERKAGSDD